MHYSGTQIFRISPQRPLKPHQALSHVHSYVFSQDLSCAPEPEFRLYPCCFQAGRRAGMEKMKRIKKRLSLTLRSSQTVDESLSELAEQMTVEDGGTKDSGNHSN